MLQVNDQAPEFSLRDERGRSFSLASHRGERLLLVFYPGDNTPVCTRQFCDYRDGVEAFAGLGVQVVGISNDNAASHRKFKTKYHLPFILLTDADLGTAERYDSKGLMGMKRSVFLIDEEGVIRYKHIESLALFRRTKEELLEVIAGLQNSKAR
jgi:thioredoxin-dependent peroxiredoxin